MILYRKRVMHIPDPIAPTVFPENAVESFPAPKASVSSISSISPIQSISSIQSIFLLSE